MTAMEKFEASSVAMKVIAGLLALLVVIGTATLANVNTKLDRIDQIGDTLAVHRMQIEGLYEMRVDLKEIKAELKAIGKKVND